MDYKKQVVPSHADTDNVKYLLQIDLYVQEGKGIITCNSFQRVHGGVTNHKYKCWLLCQDEIDRVDR